MKFYKLVPHNPREVHRKFQGAMRHSEFCLKNKTWEEIKKRGMKSGCT